MSEKNSKTQSTKSGDESITTNETAPKSNHYFDQQDWIAFWITLGVTMFAYLWTVAPDLTLEDSGELAVASQYAGVPHPPGYPIWTVYTWAFTKIIPFSNMAFRVAVSSAVAGALSAAFLTLIVSRASRGLLRGLRGFDPLPKEHENWIRMLSGVTAGLLLSFDSVLWSQSVIVEVYSLATCFFVASLLFLFRWTYSPDKDRYLYLCFLMFGVAVTNHQTLICAAIGIEVVICIIRPLLGRVFLIGNALIFIGGLIYKTFNQDALALLDKPLLNSIYWLVGFGSIAGAIYLTVRNEDEELDDFLFSMFKGGIVVLVSGVMFFLAHAAYIFMPLSSMTNPPMNWGYPRTVEGFLHAFSRGQYEPINPTDSFPRFIDQLFMVSNVIIDEFSIPLAILAFLPLCFVRYMKKRELSWWVGLSVIFVGLTFLLLALLNPDTNIQSKFQTRVFFIPTHSILAIGIGCAIALVSRLLLMELRKNKDWIVIGGSFFAMTAFVNVALVYFNYSYVFPRIAFFILFLGFVLFLGLLFSIDWFSSDKLAKSHPKLIRNFMCLSGLCFVSFSAVAHWSDSEQRGHLFGFWFGHDMFKPPFEIYEEMDQDAILFGGTDPGRFCPTYMIFSESFIPDSKKRDPDFDRRDVYIITQNALADGTYLDYIRAHYNRSTQIDPPFFQDLFRSEQEKIKGVSTNALAKIAKIFDDPVSNYGLRVEEKRKAQGLYPEKEIYIPTDRDAGLAFQDYQRSVLEQMTPEQRAQFNAFDNAIFSGQQAVFELNARLTKIIFDKNPENSFYIEESYPIEWMNPHLTPYGIIFKLNRHPVTEISQDMVDKSQRFWSKYSERLIGDWLKPETSIQDVCAFALDFLSFKDVKNYPVDPKFFRDSQAQKSFSKLRASQARLYAWRFVNAQSEEEKERMYQAAKFAFLQAFAYYPASPEIIRQLPFLLLQGGETEDAVRVAKTVTIIDPKNANFQYVLREIQSQVLNGISQTSNNLKVLTDQIEQLQSTFAEDPQNITNTISLIDAHWALGQTNEALRVVDDTMMVPDASSELLTILAEKVSRIHDYTRLEAILQVMTTKSPNNPSPFYDLGTLQVFTGKTLKGITNMATALKLNKEQLKENPNARNLVEILSKDARFNAARELPEYKTLIEPLLTH